LHEQGAISNADWDNAVASFEVAKAEVTSGKESIKAAEFAIVSANASLSEARDNLSRTTILAPKSGTITALTKELGESVLGNNMMAGEVIMSVSDLKTMEVDVEVNESDIVRVNLGDSVDIEVDAFNEKIFKGLVTEIGNTAMNANALSSMDAVTNFSVKVRILEESYSDLMDGEDDESSPFRPGMSANVEIQTESFKNVITVPIKAVSLRSDTSSTKVTSKRKFGPPTVSSDTKSDEQFECVLLVDESGEKSKLKIVKTGIQNIDYIQILDGVEEGETIIVGPYKQIKSLKTGDEISFTKKKEKEDE
jgi:HlyD family secretion protein